MIPLRDYQLELVDAVWHEIVKEPNALAVLPTGSGKTVCIAELMNRAMKAKPTIRISMVMGRIDLVTQTERALTQNLDRKHVGVYCGTLNRKELARPIIVASIQSIADIDIPHIDLLIVDETHNLDQDSGRYLKFIEKAQARNPRLKIVGFTATPFRSTGPIHGDKMLFKRIAYRKTVQEMIALGFLCEPKMKGSAQSFDVSNLRIRAGEYRQEDIDELVSNKDTVRAQVADVLSRIGDRKSVVFACANISHCNLVADELDGAIPFSSTTVHSKQNRNTRDANLASFMCGSKRFMSFVTVLSEGFDHPPIDCVVLMRPTRSPVLYVQTVGRGLRPSPGKQDCLVLDYGQVIKTLGPLDDPVIKRNRTSGDGEAPVKECPDCYTLVFAGVRQCPDCGHEFPYTPPQEKLDKKADGTAKILSEAPKPERIAAWWAYIEMHQARSGNQCVKITYCDKNTVSNIWGTRVGVQEFFVVTSPWAMERLERRLGDIGAELPGIPFDDEIEVRGHFELVKTKDGKYDRILSVKKLSEAEEDTSFDFGFNQKQGR